MGNYYSLKVPPPRKPRQGDNTFAVACSCGGSATPCDWLHQPHAEARNASAQSLSSVVGLTRAVQERADQGVLTTRLACTQAAFSLAKANTSRHLSFCGTRGLNQSKLVRKECGRGGRGGRTAATARSVTNRV